MKNLLCLTFAVSLLLSTTLNAKAAPPFKIINHIKFDEGNKIKLIIGGKTYDLQSYNLNYVPVNADKSKTEALVIGYNPTNSLSVSIKQSKVDGDFLDWIVNPDQQPKDGQIIVTDGETGKVLRTVTFAGARTQSYSEAMYTQNYNNGQVVGFNLRYKTISIKF